MLHATTPVSSSLLSHVLFLLALSWCRAGKKLEAISCADRNRLVGIKDRDRVVTVERLPGSQVSLTCHHCGQRDSGAAKRWYKTNDLWAVDEAGEEVEAGTDPDSRFLIKRDHTLVIRDLDVNDTGMYYCYDRYHSDEQHKFIYTVDMLFPQLTPPVEGSTEQDLMRYIAEYINKTVKFKLQTYWRFENIQLYLQWEAWTPCHGCKGQPGEMWRMGILRQRHVDLQQEELLNSRGQQSISYKTGLAARSMHIFMHERQLSLVLRELPDYMQRRNCSNPRRCKSKKSVRDTMRERSFLAGLGPGPRKRFTAEVYETDPVIMECPWPPERTIRGKLKQMMSKTALGRALGVKVSRPRDREVTWFYYNRALNKSSLFADSGHRMRISRDGRLMIASVRKADKGRYSCAEDGIEVAIVQLKIKPTFTLAQSKTSLRILGISFLLDFGIFVFFMVVLYRQRRVQRLLAGARWRHEQRQELRQEKARKQRFLLRKRRELMAEQAKLAEAGVDAEEVMNLLGETLLKDGDSEEVEENGREVEDEIVDVEDEGEDERADEDLDGEGYEGDEEEA